MITDIILIALAPIFAPIPLIAANENGPRPATLYGTVRIESMDRLPAHVGPLGDDGVRAVAAHRVGQVELQLFGVQAYETLDLMLQRIAFDSNIEDFEAVGIVFGEASSLEDLPVLRNISQFDPRAVATVPFSYTRAVDETLPFIETVEGEATIEGSIASVSITTPFGVTIADNP